MDFKNVIIKKRINEKGETEIYLEVTVEELSSNTNVYTRAYIEQRSQQINDELSRLQDWLKQISAAGG